MNIIVIGCGKVGVDLAKMLAVEKHDVTVIDTNADKVDRTVSQFDVQGICGNGTSYRLQLEAGAANCDLLIAVTGTDEVNLLCCLMARKAGCTHAIARIQNPIYNEEARYLTDELGLSMTINPELACAEHIAKLIESPGVLDITTFAKGRIDLIKLPIPGDSVVDGMKVYEFATKINAQTLVTAIERNNEVIIPNGSTELKAGDDMYVITRPQEIFRLIPKLGIKTRTIKSVLIAGGGNTSYYLAKKLEDLPINVKIIESNRSRCEFLSEVLPNAMIINGSIVDREVLMEEGITDSDAVVSLTNLDEENLVLSAFASKVGKGMTITRLNTISFDEVLRDLPLGAVVSPKVITTKSILQYVRALQNTHGNNIETLYRILNDRVEVLEFKVNKETKIAGKALMDMKLKKNLLVCAIVRGGKLITPGGKDEIRMWDRVVIVTTHKGLKDINDILA